MAARRLLAVMLVFLVISTVLAALAPPPADPPQTTSTTTGRRDPGNAVAPGGALLRRAIELRSGEAGLSARPEQVSGAVGDQLAITVEAPRVVTLEIPSLGLTETAGPFSPARFDLFLAAAGRHRILDAATGRRLAEIRVRPARASDAGPS